MGQGEQPWDPWHFLRRRVAGQDAMRRASRGCRSCRQRGDRCNQALVALGSFRAFIAYPHADSRRTAAQIAKVAAAANVDIATYEVVNAKHSHAVAKKAVALVREGRAEML